MKIQKFNEEFYPYKNYEEELESHIKDIIDSEVETENIPYDSSNGVQISDTSREKAAKEIIKYLKTQKDLQVFLDSDKYNL